MIQTGCFLKEEDKVYMPEYERKIMAHRITQFYCQLPKEVIRPFTEDFFNAEAEKELAQKLTFSPEKLVEEMKNALLLCDSQKYEEKKRILDMVCRYTAGEYTIFPDVFPQIVEDDTQMSLFDLI